MIRVRSRSSWRTEPTKRSAIAFARGARTGVLMILRSMAVKTASNAAVNLASRSRMRNRSTFDNSDDRRTVRSRDEKGAGMELADLQVFTTVVEEGGIAATCPPRRPGHLPRQELHHWRCPGGVPRLRRQRRPSGRHGRVHHRVGAPASGHFCIAARIPLYVVPTAPTVVEMTELNNVAQSNYDRFL